MPKSRGEAVSKVLELSAPPGIEDKYNLVRMAGEPGWPRRWSEIWSVGDVSTGKTTSLLDSTFISLEQYHYPRILWLRNTFEDLKDTVIPQLERRFQVMFDSGRWKFTGKRDILTRVRAGDNDSEGRVFFMGIDNAGSTLWGSEWFRAYISQGELVKESRLNLLHTRMRYKAYHREAKDKNGAPLLGKTFIKADANWNEGRLYMYTRVIKDGKPIHPDYPDIIERHQVGTLKNGRRVEMWYLMVQSRFEENLTNNDEYAGHILASGELGEIAMAGGWTGRRGLVYGVEYDDRFKIGRLTRYDGYVCNFAIDHGVDHPTFMVISLQDRAGRVIVVREIVNTDKSAGENARELCQALRWLHNNGVKAFYGYYDPSMDNRGGNLRSNTSYYYEEFAKLSFPVMFAPAFSRKSTAANTRVRIDDVAISDVKSLLINERFYVVEEDCPWTARCLREGTKQDIEKDTPFICDGLNALGYLGMNVVIPKPFPDTDNTALSEKEVNDIQDAARWGNGVGWGWGDENF
jgi:hypothetical protein